MKTLFKNGHIQSDSQQWPCMVVEDDHIVYVGNETNAPAADSEIDLAGRRVLPGFIDGY